mmetsp:Transcript_30959/g.50080  ORF Transcript_30959/g.50080 Transcript_30959/m.50080 type:complete len:127 (-) Transcript_30959:559-939(-)|eukprot:CAMPEP_0184656976 /NCGR_PEP_ID=MMETSP0308-20130426/16882_1 /TAXON_ID=38269 /ORGANISM="Gloeochaete witrockiana, Strain SAG 46.84" /LENGTH=126 /DNA_ID=CAMNT_0027094321 /DNA_START=36 /DNA_END=416 /DNA_ORIENTATION=-
MENVVRGALKLKGGKPLPVNPTIDKKKKKKAKKAADDSEESKIQQSIVAVEDQATEAELAKDADDSKPLEHILTPAERRHLETQKERERDKASKAAQKSHRQRIEEFNRYLGNLSEHYDIPKVGPG